MDKRNFLELDKFCSLTNLKSEVVLEMIEDGNLNTKEEEGQIFVEVCSNSLSKVGNLGVISSQNEYKSSQFVEKTIGTILSLHEKIINAKDETLQALRDENSFLKDALYSMQELYDEDRKNIKILTKQLESSQNEIEFLKRKYKLMWNKAVENYKETEGKK